MPILYRKRNKDGSLGDLEKFGQTETDADKIERLEFENANLALEVANKNFKIATVEEQIASLTLELVMKGVL